MADTINTGTMLIEEDALMPESLRFEGEPWTRFYMAGEIIRESQKASGKQSHYASEGNTAHSDEMIDHYNHPRNVGSQPKDDPNGGISLVGDRRKRLPSRTRISSANSAFPRCNPVRWPKTLAWMKQ
jgi:hypothetical protein